MHAARGFLYTKCDNWRKWKVEKILVRISTAVLVICTLIVSPAAQAMVFINEVFINPPGNQVDPPVGDLIREFIELMGTPGMKLDGYAVVVFNGTEQKYYPLDSIYLPDNLPDPGPEIDQFFSLDGLTLGDNGILALVITDPTFSRFPELNSASSDANWANWDGLWNGGLKAAGTIDNNGSLTFLLIRNRPGITEADPTNPAGLLWAKEIKHDVFLDTPVWVDPDFLDQWGDGNIDKGEPDGLGGYCLDLSGLTTTGDLSDDLEIVDELSYEHNAGWEYDTDGRHVDEDSTHPYLPHRHVHALDDPEGFNPDAISRVDYRTKGAGWAPAGGGAGEMGNGNNWQDMATEQWIRGDSVGPFGFPPSYYYDNADNTPSLQNYKTNVPLWLDDGIGAEYDFSTSQTYEIIAGWINPLAIPFIPGDTDRDGDCDDDDIAKIAAVFGDDDWIFSNSFPEAPETDRGDPNTQTKPWDVDGTGDNGIEASDMQWVLNFQGDATGQIVGREYYGSTPASSGVVLNTNSAVVCTISTSVNIPGGRTLSTLLVGDTVEITVKGQLTAGANSTTDEENGIMQYIHDVIIDTPDVVKVISVEPLGSFNTTRASLQQKQGTDGDLGMDTINGYTTSFTEGLSAPDDMYKITLSVIGGGSADVSVTSAAMAKFAASTPEGVKVGHTDNNGDPASSSYPSAISVSTNPADITANGCIDIADFGRMAAAWLSTNPGPAWDADCDISSPFDEIDFADLNRLLEDWLTGCGM
ncbi:MAG: hypothetical protein DRP66_02920 [Planctomycetota bacterium]|nr:MAG: hypothetical protein DRP66_02920 [Planctomycetota bacterium]